MHGAGRVPGARNHGHRVLGRQPGTQGGKNDERDAENTTSRHSW
jgi:hypothetical protein